MSGVVLSSTFQAIFYDLRFFRDLEIRFLSFIASINNFKSSNGPTVFFSLGTQGVCECL